MLVVSIIRIREEYVSMKIGKKIGKQKKRNFEKSKI